MAFAGSGHKWLLIIVGAAAAKSLQLILSWPGNSPRNRLLILDPSLPGAAQDESEQLCQLQSTDSDELIPTQPQTTSPLSSRPSATLYCALKGHIRSDQQYLCLLKSPSPDWKHGCSSCGARILSSDSLILAPCWAIRDEMGSICWGKLHRCC